MTPDTSPNIEIIAELAQGFEGRPEQARLLVRAAAAAGADAAKFQLVYADELATPDYKYYELFRSLEMTDAVWQGLAEYAKQLGIALHLDVFGARSVALAERVGAQALKVHGTDIANVSLLNQIAQTSVPKVLLGAGGAFLPEIEQAINLLAGKEVVVLLGYQGYPTPTDGNQIARVRRLTELLSTRNPNVSIGFADHASPESSLRLTLAATALGAGARVFEKHLTLGEVMKMEDHEAALNPDRFAEFSAILRDCAAAYGECSDTADFGMGAAEQGYRGMIRRHVVSGRAIATGTRIEPADLVLKRSAADTPLTDLTKAYGATLKRDIAANTPLLQADLSDTGDAV
ncbi:MAG: NeuB family protein [Burkholderiaceae bacterium]|nr:MAG: NeuB family protein [Burkholderiaceae bacterium]